jgi:hypothetical protein
MLIAKLFCQRSAFLGKLGAAVGAYSFPVISDSSWGYQGVFWINAGVCLAGAVFCFFLLQDPPSWEDFLASQMTEASPNESPCNDPPAKAIGNPQPENSSSAEAESKDDQSPILYKGVVQYI